MARDWKLKTLKTLSIGLGLTAALLIAPYAPAHDNDDDDEHHPGKKRDFGIRVEDALARESLHLFGVFDPVEESSTASIDQATAQGDPRKLVTLAKGLRARVVSSAANLGPITDMMALWPDDKHPTHLITCNEGG